MSNIIHATTVFRAMQIAAALDPLDNTTYHSIWYGWNSGGNILENVAFFDFRVTRAQLLSYVITTLGSNENVTLSLEVDFVDHEIGTFQLDTAQETFIFEDLDIVVHEGDEFAAQLQTPVNFVTNPEGWISEVILELEALS